MDRKQLQYFMEVAELGSFTRAAEKWYITQPALSRMIKALEDDAGSPLFIRSRRDLTMTEAGAVLYKHAEVIEKQFHQLETELGNLRTLKKGNIRIGLPTVVNSFFFSRLMSTFHKEYPEVTFQLEEAGSKRIEDGVVQDKLDFGVVVLPAKHDNLDYFTFVNEHLNAVVPAAHMWSNRREISLRAFKNETFILFNQDFTLRNLVLRACDDAGFQPHVISETSQLDFIEEMVASHLGITLLPESTCNELTENVRSLRVVDPLIDWNLAIIWKSDGFLPQLNKEFIRFAKERLT